MKYVSLDEIVSTVQNIEENTCEPTEVTNSINGIVSEFCSLIKKQNPHIKIITDYDADGICSAYIIQKTLEKFNYCRLKSGDIEVEVSCNDRRNPYGVPEDIKRESSKDNYIVLDMGSNQYDYIMENLGSNTIIIDHHIIEDDRIKELFNSRSTLLNPHSTVCSDGKSAEYCATGLAYRVCQTLINDYEKGIGFANSVIPKIKNLTENLSETNCDEIIDTCLQNDIDVQVSGNIEGTVVTADGKSTPVNSIYLEFKPQNDDNIAFQTVLYENKYTGKVLAENSMTAIYLQSAGGTEFAKQFINSKTELFHSPFDEKFKNTLDIIAGIGTIADVVNVLDEHSYNRNIIKAAINAINNADINNTDAVIGYMLSKCGIGREDVTARQIAFNVSSFINSQSRMSEILGINGADEFYKTLTSPPKVLTYLKFDNHLKIHSQRKDLVNDLQSSQEYLDFVHSHRYGEYKDREVAIYRLPDNTPSAFCGLIAGKLTSAIDKATICVTYNNESKIFSGSARNTSGKESLKDFMDNALSCSGTEGLEIKYGGHSNAVGISSLNNLEQLSDILYNNQYLFKDKQQHKLLLNCSLKELTSAETVKTLLSLEPLGEGLKMPPVEIEGKLNVSASIKKKGGGEVPYWKKVKLGTTQLSDFQYEAETYPQDSKGKAKMLAEINLTNYRGLKVDFTAHYDRIYMKELYETLEKQGLHSKKQVGFGNC